MDKIPKISYYTWQTPAIQLIWNNENSYKLTKVYAIFFDYLKNIPIFLYNGYVGVRNLFSREVEPVVLPSVQEKMSPSFNYNKIAGLLPYVGVAAGIVLGSLHRHVNDIGFYHKANCRNIPGLRFSALNTLKQLETKHFVLLTPLAILAYNVGRDYFSKKREERSIVETIKRQFTLKDAAYFGIAATLAITNSLYAKPLGLDVPSYDVPWKPGAHVEPMSGYATSGHLMMKVVLAPLMSHLFSKVVPGPLGLAAAGTYAFTDALFVYKTNYFCHNQHEMLVGVVQGCAILAMGKLASMFSFFPQRDDCGPLLDFYQGVANDKGVYFEDILKWDDQKLEDQHDYIQWLFPLTTKSPYNPTAPTTDDKSITLFKNDPVLRGEMLKAFKRMLKFYGFEMDSKGNIVQAANFNKRAANWVTSGNHNYLRITRILKSLELHGLGIYKAPFLKALEKVAADHPNRVGKAVNFWRSALSQ